MSLVGEDLRRVRGGGGIRNTPDLATVGPPDADAPLPLHGAEGRCRMKDCPRPTFTPFWCEGHLRRLATDMCFAPIITRHGTGEYEPPTYTVCGLCETVVWPLRRIDDPRERVWAIEAQSHPGGLVWIRDGGFAVVRASLAAVLIGVDGVPLYRNHPPLCEPRKILAERLR